MCFYVILWITFMRPADASCPVARIATLLGDHCSLLIVRDLLDGPKRFCELESSLGVSTRTLTSKLKNLEREGILLRQVTTKTHIEYSLTPKGAGLKDIIHAARMYGEQYL